MYKTSQWNILTWNNYFIVWRNISFSIFKTFLSPLFWSLSVDSIWLSLRTIQRGRCYTFDWVNDVLTLNNFADWNSFITCWIQPLASSQPSFNIVFEYSIWSARYWFFIEKSWWFNYFWITKGTNFKRSDFQVLENQRYFISIDMATFTAKLDLVDLNFWANNIASNATFTDQMRVWASCVSWFFGSCSLYDLRIYSVPKNWEDLQNIMDWWIDNVGLEMMMKMDEWAWTVAYDSSGNGRHWIHANWVQHIELTNWKWADFQNQYWYTDNLWSLIPRNESNISEDVLWFPLQFDWRVKYNSLLRWRYMIFDWVNDYLWNQPWIDFWTTNFTISFMYKHTTSWSWLFRTIFSNSYNVTPGRFAIYLRSNRMNLYRWAPYVDMWTVWPIFNVWQIYNIQLVRNWSSFAYVIDWVSYPLSSFAWNFGGTQYLMVGNSSTNIFNNMEIRDLSINLWWDIIAYWAMDEWWGSVAYDSSGNGRHFDLINWVARGVWQYWSIQYITQWHTDNAGVAIPRNIAIPSEDVMWWTLQYVGDWQSLLPNWIVDFNYRLAPELINESVPNMYEHWDTLPNNMQKNTSTYKETNFRLLKS